MNRVSRAAPWTAAALLPLVAACADESATGPLPGVPPTILEITPAVLQAGGTGTLKGVNFSEDPEENSVRVARTPASIEAAAQTALQIQLPDASEAPCQPTQQVPVSVTVAGRQTEVQHRFRVASLVDTTLGEFVRISDTSRLGCREFPAGEQQYVLSLFNPTESPVDRIDVRIEGRAGAGEESSSQARRAPGAGLSDAARRALRSPALPEDLRAALEGRVAHQRVLARNLELLRRKRELARRRGPEGVRRRSPAERVQRATPPAAGDLVDFRIPDLGASGSLCTNFQEATGRVVQVTEHAVLVSDTANSIDGQFDDRVREMGREFEDRMWPVLRENFGDPLAYQSKLDDDGHVFMFFSPKINRFGNVLAFVFAGDFLPRGSGDAECESSDRAEVFYAVAPTRIGESDDFSLETTRGWQRVLRSTMIHEVKHVTSFAERFARAPSLEELTFPKSWLEEATAMVSEEIYARGVFGYSFRGNTTYRESVYCEVRPTDPECEGSPLVMTTHFFFLAEYLADLESRSLLGPTSTGDVSWLGAGWWFVRWALDHASASEAAVLSGLTQQASLAGVENVEAQVSPDFTSMLADWTLSLPLDDKTEFAVDRARLSVPSWNSRDIYSGFHQDFGQNIDLFATPFPLNSRIQFYGDFDQTIQDLRGGTAAIVRLIGEPGATQLFELSGVGGGIPDALRASMIRVE